MHEKYMRKALSLAKKGLGAVDPNPLVGAVIVKDNQIIGQGYHEAFGQAHAEVNAFKDASEDVTGATMYVTLEPCSHYGKTPPCAKKIIEKKISKVVIASVDPNPLVAGKGIKMLRDAGIEVITGVLDQENRKLNRVFFKYINKRKPYVVLKTAMSLDGKIATYKNESKWITNEQSRQVVHQMRKEYMGIMVGVDTIIHDNPRLTCRIGEDCFRQPVRIILDSKLRIHLDAFVLKDAQAVKTLIFTTDQASKEKINQIKETGAFVYQTKAIDNRVNLNETIDKLGELGVSSILLEGGSTLNFSCLKMGIVDEVHAFIAPIIIGGKEAPTPVGGQGFPSLKDTPQLKLIESNHIDGDVHLIYQVLKEDSNVHRNH
ncbi:MAG: bifunctional diaminohydroxyphosphoribosylaminopyrimidine deaminase/5-amino-6-(5-phosphoribosylamino)uracil reductase RibD [Candidatus Izemoplasmatales bacterium]